MIFLSVVGIVALALVSAGSAYAQGDGPTTPCEPGSSDCNGHGGKGLLRDYVQSALADILDVPVEEIQAQREAGNFFLKDYVEEQGLTQDEIADLIAEVFTTAIDQALADDAITQEQADWILERKVNSGRGFNGPCGRWQKNQ